MLIFPAIDLISGRCVRLVQGDYRRKTVYNTSPADQAMIWAQAGASLIHLVDLDGARTGHVVNSGSIRGICRTVDIPCELGGGIRTLRDAELAFSLGAARVILGTAVGENPETVENFLRTFGAEKIVIGIDARDGLIALRGWRQTGQITALALAKRVADLGATRIIFTDVATDGAFTGPSLGPLAELGRAVPECRIVASGGIASPRDIAKLAALNLDNLEGVIVGKALYDGRTTYRELAAAATGTAGRR